MTRFRFVIAVLCIVQVGSLFAQSSAAVDDRFKRCMRLNDQGSMGTGRCYAEQLNRLTKKQEDLLLRLEAKFKLLASEGVRHDDAVDELKKSQLAWKEYLRADCALGDSLFGLGNGAPFEEMTCQINHIYARNLRLSKLL